MAAVPLRLMQVPLSLPMPVQLRLLTQAQPHRLMRVILSPAAAPVKAAQAMAVLPLTAARPPATGLQIAGPRTVINNPAG